MPIRALPVLTINKVHYVFDERLRQLRTLDCMTFLDLEYWNSDKIALAIDCADKDDVIYALNRSRHFNLTSECDISFTTFDKVFDKIPLP